MRMMFRKQQFMMTFLVSTIIGLLGGMVITWFGYVFQNPFFFRKINLLPVIWLTLGIASYVLVTMCAYHWPTLRMMLTLDHDFSFAIRKVFLLVFLCFPISVILFVQFGDLFAVSSFSRYQAPVRDLLMQDGNNAFFLTFLVAWLFFLGACLYFYGVLGTEKNENLRSDFFYIFVIVAVAVVLRVICIRVIDTQPYSDFELIYKDALAISQGEPPQRMYVATQVMITMIYGGLFKILGASLLVAKIFNLVCYSLAGIFLYFAGKEIFDSRFLGGLTGFIMVAWPSLLIYSNVLSSEHVFILIECVLLYVLVRFFKRLNQVEEKPLGKRTVFWYFLLGLLFGLLSLFRPFSQLYLVALIITLFVFGYMNGFKKLVTRGVGIILLLIVFWLVSIIPDAVANHYDNLLSNIRPCNFLVGMNVETAGFYNREDVTLCVKLQAQSLDRPDFMRRVILTVIQRVRENQSSLFLFVVQKFTILWANSGMILQWAANFVPGAQFPIGLTGNLLIGFTRLNLVDFAVMLSGMVISLIGVVIALFKDVKPVIFLSLLVLFGFNLMEFMLEAQTRYRIVLIPLLVLFFVWSLGQIKSIVSQRTTREEPLT